MRFRLGRLGSTLILMLLATGLLALGAPAASAVAGAGFSTDISQGLASGCAITPAQTLKCWGDNSTDQLGFPNTGVELSPVTVPGLSNVRKVSVGDYTTCVVIGSAGALKCFGYNGEGEVGSGVTGGILPITQVLGLESGVKNVAVGDFHVCAVRTNGTVWCWGYNGRGQVGQGPAGLFTYDTPQQVAGISGATQIAAGAEYSCAVANGAAKCWGANTAGKLGSCPKGIITPPCSPPNTDPSDHNTPVQVAGLTNGVKKIAAGTDTTCAIIAESPWGRNGLKCWGDNTYGQTGTNTVLNEYHHPAWVYKWRKDVTSVDTRGRFTCGVKNGRAKCWGRNDVNQIGDGTTFERTIPYQVVGLATGVQQVEVGNQTGCARLVNGVTRCWGYNGFGEVGVGSLTTQFPTPQTLT